MMNDSLGDRMKRQYEDRTRIMLPRRTYTVIRCDGRAFHTYTRNCERPWDASLANAMAVATMALCREAQGACFGYTQSDEISVLLTDFSTTSTDAWFDGNLQKIVSIAASVVTRAFNSLRSDIGGHFDARAFTIPDPVEVENYFIWRQKDAERNSLSALAQAHFSQRQLHGKSQADMHDMLHDIGINWNDCPDEQKRGCAAIYEQSLWISLAPPIWTQDRDWLTSRIPRIWEPQPA